MEKIKDFKSLYFKKRITALAGVAQWIECWPTNQRVAGSILGQGACLGCRPLREIDASLTH